jgi:hypothetical protein
MAEPNELLCNIPPFTAAPSAMEVLERLRDSYKGLLQREALTGPDQAVLEIILKHVARPG